LGRRDVGAELIAQERIGAAIVRTVAALPRPALRSLAGRPIVIDGQRLDPEVQLLTRLLGRGSGAPFDTPEEARTARKRDARIFRGETFAVGQVQELTIPGPAGPIAARLYVPEQARGPVPLLVYLHGGGWVVCDLDTHDNVCRFLAREAGVLVLSVDYRLSPEHPFPAAVDDALAAFQFGIESAGEVGADPKAVAVGGDSAGGNLAAVVSHLAVSNGGPVPAFTLNLYPVTDLSRKRASYRLFGQGFPLTEEHMDWYRGHYLEDGAAALDPRASPLLADDLSGLPPTYIATAGFDLLRDEGEEYARRLSEAGVPVALKRHPGLIHGFVNAVGSTRFGRIAAQEAAGALRVGLAAGRLGSRAQ
jgi:acetyl esterase